MSSVGASALARGKELAGRFSYLLVFLLALLLLSPFAAATGGLRGKLLSLLAGLAVLAALYSISDQRRVLRFGLILAIPAFLHRITASNGPPSPIGLAGLICSILFDLFITFFILVAVGRDERIRSETIYGAICAYITLGYAFANMYVLMVHLQPSALYLDPLLNTHKVALRPDLIFYSFTTLTSLGCAGISPASAPARSLTMLETIVGVMYLAVLVARLIGLHTSQRVAR